MPYVLWRNNPLHRKLHLYVPFQIPIYDSDGVDQVQWMLEESGMYDPLWIVDVMDRLKLQMMLNDGEEKRLQEALKSEEGFVVRIRAMRWNGQSLTTVGVPG